LPQPSESGIKLLHVKKGLQLHLLENRFRNVPDNQHDVAPHP
jgi:hypothetical protein